MMEAGRELDILIAEKVFGRIPCEQWEYFRVGELIKTCNHEECYPKNSPANYSTNMSAAWEVHKNICGRKFSERCTYYEGLDIILQAKAPIKERVADLWLLSYLEPDDICFAALRVVSIG